MTLFWRPSGCVLWYDFAEKSGNTVHDLSGNGNHGTINGATWKSGRLIGALKFNGSTDYVEVPVSSSLQLTTALTLEAIIYILSDTGIYQGVVGRFNGSYNYRILVRPTTLLYQHQRNDGTYFGITATISSILKKATYIVATYSTADSVAKLYLNGDEVQSATESATLQDNEPKVKVGMAQDTYYPLAGYIYLVRIYNRALSEKEIKTNYRYLFSAMKQKVPSRYIPRGVRV